MPLLYGKVDDTKVVVPVQVNSDGVISVAEQNPDQTAQNYGYINGGWIKNPLQFGISSVLANLVSNTSIESGTTIINAPPCPPNKIHVITQISVVYVGTVTNVRCEVRITTPTVVRLHTFTNLASNVSSGQQGNWIITEDDYVSLVIYGGTLNNTGRLYHSGYIIDLNP